MAPSSHGRRALLYFDLRQDDLLGGPQPHSKTLQKHVIFGLWGEKDDGSSLQATTYMFSAAVGARGHLLECSKSEARLCALLGVEAQDAFFLEAKWHAWHSVWSFEAAWNARAAQARSSEQLAEASSSLVPWWSQRWQADRDFGMPCLQGFSGGVVTHPAFSYDDGFLRDAGNGPALGALSPGRPQNPNSCWNADAFDDDCCDFAFFEGVASEISSDTPFQDSHVDQSDFDGDYICGGRGREWPRGPEKSRLKHDVGADCRLRGAECCHGASFDDSDFDGDSTGEGCGRVWSQDPRKSRPELAAGADSKLRGAKGFQGLYFGDTDPDGDVTCEDCSQEWSQDPRKSWSEQVIGADSKLCGDNGSQGLCFGDTDPDGDITCEDCGQEWSQDPRKSESEQVFGAASDFTCCACIHGFSAAFGDSMGGLISGSSGQEWSKDPGISKRKLMRNSSGNGGGQYLDPLGVILPKVDGPPGGPHATAMPAMVGAAFDGDLRGFADAADGGQSFLPLPMIGKLFGMLLGSLEGRNGGDDPLPCASPGLDALSFLGPGLLDTIKSAIQKIVEQAVKQSLEQAGLQQQPLSAKARNRKRAKLKKAALKRGGTGGPSGSNPSAPVAAKAAGKGDDGKGKGQPKGKGKGHGHPPASNAAAPPGPKSPHNDGWQLAQRKPAADEQFMLRPQDWNSPLIMFSDFAAKFEAADAKVCFEAVVHCTAAEIAIARRSLGASSREYSTLLVAVDLSKKQLLEHALSKEAGVKQAIPGKVGAMIKFREGLAVQCTSSGKGAPQPKHIGSSHRVEAKETGVLFVKVPQAFVSKDQWSAFIKNPRHAIAAWASRRHVQLTDSWKWSEEKLGNNATQIFGIIRAPKADLPTLLGCAGVDGVFTFPPSGQKERVTIEWIDRLPKESDKDYFARAHRAQSIGLACHGVRLGWKKPITEATRFSRVWQLNGCPRHWDMVQAAGVVEASFHEVKMIRQSVRGSEKSFLFRGAAKAGADCDLLPIAAEDGDDGHLMLWACLAPARPEQVRQKRLRGGSLPFVEAQVAPFTPVTKTIDVTPGDSQEPQDMDTSSAGDAKGTETAEEKKEEGNTKRAKIALREVPAQCSVQAVPRVADHIERHAADYEPAWTADGKPGPAGSALQDWNTFVQQVAMPGKYSGEVELKALCRLFSIRAVLFPADPRWHVCAYGKAKQRKVGAIYFHDKHFDFLKPDEAKYPKEIVSVVTDSNGGFLVGGISEACSDSAPSSVHRGISLAATSVLGTSRPVQTRLRSKTCMPATAKGAGISAACTESTAADDTARTPAASIDTAGAGYALASSDRNMPVRGPGQKRKLFCVDGYARRRLCPWQRACSDDVTAACLQVAHFRAMHPGETPAGTQAVKDMIRQLPDGQHWWRCPLWEQGIPFEIGREACQRRVAAEIRAHKTAAHPKVRWAKWRGLDYQGRAERATVTRYNAQVCKQLQRKPDIVAGFSFFRWPCLRGQKRTRITEVAFRASWQCKVCFFPCRTDKHAREHLKLGCPHLPGTKHPMPLHVHLKHAKQRLSKLEQVRELFANSRCSAEAKARGLTFFAGAKAVLERPLDFHGSPCF
ncbi:unnamed protein product [Symbiodinium microadriaticum]|nr:unnamed protein product [Symbiodinium sp. KB8]CAE7255678.1 unnamed protein product [Symbiodinium microadriaticum]